MKNVPKYTTYTGAGIFGLGIILSGFGTLFKSYGTTKWGTRGMVLGIIVLLVGGIWWLVNFFKKKGDSPSPSPVDSPASVGDGINDAVDKEIKEIADDVEKSAKEGYISRREYYSSDPAQSAGEFVRIVLSNIMGKPIKAVIERDDVSGVLKVLMTGVDPKVFEPSLSVISNCVSEKIKTASPSLENIDPMTIYNCTNDYFSKNGKEFEDKIVPAALTIVESVHSEYASPEAIKAVENRGGVKRFLACEFDRAGKNPQYTSMDDCFKGAQTPEITWDKANAIMKRRLFPSPSPEPYMESPMPEPYN